MRYEEYDSLTLTTLSERETRRRRELLRAIETEKAEEERIGIFRSSGCRRLSVEQVRASLAAYRRP